MPVAQQRRGGHEDKIIISLDNRGNPLNAVYARFAAERVATVPFADRIGLRVFQALPSNMRASIRRDVYFLQHDQVVDVLIECDIGHASPPCVHWFNALGLGFELTYSVDHIEDWRIIQDGVTAIVRGFLEQAP